VAGSDDALDAAAGEDRRVTPVTLEPPDTPQMPVPPRPNEAVA
jgi:hypothetical protein